MDYFKETKEVMKKIPILPAISYFFVIILFLGSIIKAISTWGNLSYIITAFISPLFITNLDLFSEGQLLKTLRKNWVELPTLAHILFILDVVILYYFIDILKNFLINEYGKEKISTNS